ncbi:hypothetical protein HNR73_003370 [Phytomonospora endophytica]|uniref:Uncharacterized protein n=1 Tax=Phytomonospora endophytica TaxID=714109 RepID=A0A841FKR7_9ACTN|nr:hypothetical protein [Phytomonospora endophytica]
MGNASDYKVSWLTGRRFLSKSGPREDEEETEDDGTGCRCGSERPGRRGGRGLRESRGRCDGRGWARDGGGGGHGVSRPAGWSALRDGPAATATLGPHPATTASGRDIAHRGRSRRAGDESSGRPPPTPPPTRLRLRPAVTAARESRVGEIARGRRGRCGDASAGRSPGRRRGRAGRPAAEAADGRDREWADRRRTKNEKPRSEQGPGANPNGRRRRRTEPSRGSQRETSRRRAAHVSEVGTAGRRGERAQPNHGRLASPASGQAAPSASEHANRTPLPVGPKALRASDRVTPGGGAPDQDGLHHPRANTRTEHPSPWDRRLSEQAIESRPAAARQTGRARRPRASACERRPRAQAGGSRLRHERGGSAERRELAKPNRAGIPAGAPGHGHRSRRRGHRCGGRNFRQSPDRA